MISFCLISLKTKRKKHISRRDAEIAVIQDGRRYVKKMEDRCAKKMEDRCAMKREDRFAKKMEDRCAMKREDRFAWKIKYKSEDRFAGKIFASLFPLPPSPYHLSNKNAWKKEEETNNGRELSYKIC